jgi:hypothetical protein
MAYATVYTSNSEFMLLSVLDLLREEGIPVFADGNLGVINLVLPQITSTGSIQVNAEDAERALELIAGFQGTLGELAEAEEPAE